MKGKFLFGIIVVALLALSGWYVFGSQTPSAVKEDKMQSLQDSGQKVEALPGKKALVVYFSYTGHTRLLAEQIQQMTGADIFELQPAVPYSKDYKTVEQQGKKEVDEGYKPELKAQVPDLASYDVIFVGTPIWWYTVSPVTAAFLSNPALAGKTIVPFCTHGGYGAGHSLEDMRKTATKSTVLDELVLEGSDKGYDRKNILAWLNKAGFGE